jgi:hypothetical protein
MKEVIFYATLVWGNSLEFPHFFLPPQSEENHFRLHFIIFLEMAPWVVKCSGCDNWEEISSPSDITLLLQSDVLDCKSVISWNPFYFIRTETWKANLRCSILDLISFLLHFLRLILLLSFLLYFSYSCYFTGIRTNAIQDFSFSNLRNDF